MIHFLEHVKHPVAVLYECNRVLRPGGHLNIVVPYWRTESAHSDLDHKSFWTEDSLVRVLNNPYYEKNNRKNWKLEIGMNIIAGITERNLMLLAQLIRM
jgi:SAM-dependent methyltransferase